MTNTSPHFDAELGKRLRLLRVTRGVSQQKLAAMLGVSFQQLQKYELGTNRISFERICKLCQVFGVDMDYWTQGPSKHSAPYISDLFQNKGALKLVQHYNRIHNPRAKRVLELVARAMVQC